MLVRFPNRLSFYREKKSVLFINGVTDYRKCSTDRKLFFNVVYVSPFFFVVWRERTSFLLVVLVWDHTVYTPLIRCHLKFIHIPEISFSVWSTFWITYYSRLFISIIFLFYFYDLYFLHHCLYFLRKSTE